MRLFDGSTNDIFMVFGLGILAILTFRCLYICVYPFICCIEPKIANNENNENNENANNLHNIINNENTIVTRIYLDDIPLVEASLDNDEEMHKNIPIATLV